MFLLLVMASLMIAVRPAGAVALDVVPTWQQAAAEEQLAEKYAPIAMLKRQEAACDDGGEPYAPAPVEIVFDDPAVTLRDAARDDRIVTRAPAAADLFRRDTVYLDLPGNPRAPGCDFERFSRAGMEGRQPVAYAHIVVNPILNKLALQYWLYYVFNDFNNTHESDWEMVQLVFDASSAEAALHAEPVEVGFAQHGGGEKSAWDDAKVEKEGDSPVIYVVAGSHATQYGRAVYLGWSENGTSFGCDDTTGPSIRVPLEARLIPDDRPDRESAFAWTTYRGHWGEKQPWEYNGPTGPNMKPQWVTPFSWQDGLRESSLAVPAAATLGPAPTSFFCDGVELGALVLTRWQVYPVLIPLGVLLAMVAVASLLWLAKSVLGGALVVYGRHAETYATIGLMHIPVGIVAALLQYLLVNFPPGEQLFALVERSPGAHLAAALTVGGVGQLVALIIVGPAVIVAVADAQAGKEPGFRRSYRVVGRQFRRLAGAVTRVVVVVAVLAISVVGIPWAIVRAVQWLFVAQAAILDGAGPRVASWRSAQAVAGRWWRTAGTAVLLSVIAAAPGPIVGVLLLVFASASLGFVNGLSSLLYAIALPFSVIGFTLLYRGPTGGERGIRADELGAAKGNNQL